GSEGNDSRAGLWTGCGSRDSRSQQNTIIRDTCNHGSQLEWRNANLLPHRDCADGNFGPTAQGFGKPACFAGKLNAGLLPETISPDILVKPFIAQAQRNFDRADVARIRQNA